MAVKKEACKNHSQKKTSRNCYQCHQPICPQCQRHYSHHLFCSVKCFALWWTKTYLQPLIKRPDFITFAAFTLLIQLVLYLFLSSSISNLDDKIDNENRAQSYVINNDSSAVQLSKIWIDSARFTIKRTIAINFETNDGILYSIWNNGIFINAVSGENGEMADLRLDLEPGENCFTIWRMDGKGATALVDSFLISLSSYRQKLLSSSINRIRTNHKILALTFDGGSSKRGAKELLRALDSLKIKSTIFLTGQFIQNYPDLTRQIAADGHEVGNHSYSHPHLTSYEKNGRHETLFRVNRTFLQSQLERTDSLYRAVSGELMAPLWRAPYGEINMEIAGWAAERDYVHINWSNKCDSWDWVSDTTSQLYRSNQDMIDHFLNLEKERGLRGKIILMHLASERDGEMPYKILPALNDSLKNRGYSFGTIGELIKLSGQEHIYSKN